MEVLDARPNRKRLAPEDILKLEEERNLRSSEKLATLPAEQKLKILATTNDLQESLVGYLTDAGADPQILDKTNKLVSQLGNALLRAAGAPASSAQMNDLSANLVGVSMVLDVSRESRFDTASGELPLIRRFLELVTERLGRAVELAKDARQ